MQNGRNGIEREYAVVAGRLEVAEAEEGVEG